MAIQFLTSYPPELIPPSSLLSIFSKIFRSMTSRQDPLPLICPSLASRIVCSPPGPPPPTSTPVPKPTACEEHNTGRETGVIHKKLLLVHPQHSRMGEQPVSAFNNLRCFTPIS